MRVRLGGWDWFEVGVVIPDIRCADSWMTVGEVGRGVVVQFAALIDPYDTERANKKAASFVRRPCLLFAVSW